MFPFKTFCFINNCLDVISLPKHHCQTLEFKYFTRPCPNPFCRLYHPENYPLSDFIHLRIQLHRGFPHDVFLPAFFVKNNVIIIKDLYFLPQGKTSDLSERQLLYLLRPCIVGLNKLLMDIRYHRGARSRSIHTRDIV